MAKIKTIMGFFIAALIIGIGVFISPEVGYAQATMNGATSVQAECKLEKEDNDDDDKADQAKLIKEAQITMEQARAAALGRVAGNVLKEEIEKERGRLQYTFDVCKDGKLYDVEVDAKTGAVLQAGLDDEDDDDDEDGEENDSPEMMQAKLAKEAKISIEQARSTALAKVSGTITEEELEMENGKLVYSIEVRDANQKTFDVEVDAKTGAIVNVEEENDDDEEDDDGEKQKQMKKKPWQN
jgi:uncharacterized membrane protein YkoI